MPKHLLQEVVARANGQVIFTIHAVWRFPHPLLTLMLWHFLNVVVLRIEGTDANLLWLYIVHFIDAKAILVITIGSQESPHLRRQRMLLANHLHIENSVERKIPHSLLLIGKGIISLGTWIGFPFGRRTLFLHSSFFTLHSYHIPSLLEESHEGRLQHHVLLLAISRGVEELQEILLVYRTEDVIQIFRMIRRFVEYHLVVVLQQVAQGGEAHGTQHPLRHIVTLHGVFLQIKTIAIRLATTFHTDAQLRLYGFAIAMERAQLQFLTFGIGVSISPLIGYLLERQATTLQEGDEPTIEFHSIVHFLLFYDH